MVKTDWLVFGTYSTHPINIPDTNLVKVELTEYRELKMLFNKSRPDAVIHTAAISSPDLCQENPAFSSKINVEASKNIAGLCSDFQIPCLFISSDLVFNGLNPPYSEDDELSPVNIYGEQKALAEIEMKARNPKTVICRLPLMFGYSNAAALSFIQPLINKILSQEEVILFNDEFRTPVSVKKAAEGLILILEQLPEVIHLGGKERISRYDFGKLVADILSVQNTKLVKCNRSDLVLASPRPPDVSLNSERAFSLGFQPRDIVTELKELLSKKT